MRCLAHDLDVGPWLVVRNLVPLDARLHGEPITLDASIAIAYSCSVMIELIQEHGDVGLPRSGATDASDCTFHHVGRTSTDFAADHERLSQQRGAAIVYEASLPADLGGGRFAYFEGIGSLPGYLEVVELTPELTALFTSVGSAAEQWDRQSAVIDAGALLTGSA